MTLKRALRTAFAGLERLCDRAFPEAWNPLLQLGALGWFLFWIITVSGIYLYVFFDTGVTRAYESLEAITHGQWWAGGVMRSLHRYASDALVVVALVHLLREYSLDRLRGNRWFAWVTGLVLLLFIYVCGITGYWLVWDMLAQYVAVVSSEWLDALPLFGASLARNFLNEPALSSRFFTLMAYVHIAAPLLMLLFMWVHIQRHARARVNPSRGLGVLVLAALTVLSLAWPALSQAPADLDRVPATVGLDWFYLAAYPLVQRWGAAELWLAGGLLLLGLVLLPWLPPRKAPAAAVVNLENCNGCGRCFADCPFGAITLVRRSDGRAYDQQAAVDPAQCMACGLCVGACPTATPFRRASAFVAGIELPGRRLDALRSEIEEATRHLAGDARLLVFRCGHGARVGPDGATAIITVPCVGMIPPSFVDYALTRKLANGVVFAGCAANGCYERLGDQWVEQRIAGQRDPWLRERVSRERVAVSWRGAGEGAARAADLEAFRRQLTGSPAPAGAQPAGRGPAWRRAGGGWSAPARWLAQAVAVVAVCVPVAALATYPAWRQLEPATAVVLLSFSHAAQPVVACKKLTPAELAALKPNMRREVGCARARWPIYLELDRDGQALYRGTRQAAGLWNDGPVAFYERFTVPAGPQRLTVRMRETGAAEGFDHVASREVELVPEQKLVIDFSQRTGFTFR